MGSAGQDLLARAAVPSWGLLERWRVEAASALNALRPQAGLVGTVLDQRLLEPIRPSAIASTDPAVTALTALLEGLLPVTFESGPTVRLHGFDPGGGAPRGLALAVTMPGTTLVAALVSAGPAGIAFEIAATGGGSFGPVDIILLDGWTLEAAGQVAGGARLLFPRGAPPTVLDAGAPISATWAISRTTPDRPLVLGSAQGRHIAVAAPAMRVATNALSGRGLEFDLQISLSQAVLSLAADALAGFLGNTFDLPIELALRADLPNGLTFVAGGVRTTLPANLALRGVNLRNLDVALSSGDTGVTLDFSVALTSAISGFPITLAVEGIGASFPVALGSGGFGIDGAAVRPIAPAGIGVDLALPVISGGGFLATTGSGGYGGVMELDLGAVTVQAFGLLQLPGDGQPLSFAAILSAQFPFPGIELGFGFSLTGVGGIVALNRRIDIDALEAAVSDGSADQLLFPANPAGHAAAIVAAIGRVFPVAEGHLVIGPMLQVSWGGRILSISVAVVIDLRQSQQLVIIGRLTLALPDPAVPLVLIKATLVGTFELSPVASTTVRASLTGSSLAGLPLHGDLLFMVRGGDDAAFVLSVGGFHPRYRPPAGVPDLRRIQIDIAPPGFPGLRSDSYVAVTSNSVQFGAHLELCLEIAGCGIDGWFVFDTLFMWDPVFSFSVHCAAGVAVQVLGKTLMGISFDLWLEGPGRWHAHGTGTLHLFLFSASLDFDVAWGDVPAVLPPPLDVRAALAHAFAERAAWVGVPPADDHAMVILSNEATQLVGGGGAVHPLGQVVVHERALPLDVAIARFQNRPIPVQTWTISAAVPSLGAAMFDEFPAGAFLELSEDEKLSRPAFERFRCGTVLAAGAVTAGPLRAVDTDFEVVLIPNESLGVPRDRPFHSAAAEAWLAIRDLHRHRHLWGVRPADAVAVLAVQPIAVATTDTLRAQPLVAAVAGFTATMQAARRQFGAVGPTAAVQIVERWELAQ